MIARGCEPWRVRRDTVTLTSIVGSDLDELFWLVVGMHEPSVSYDLSIH